MSLQKFLIDRAKRHIQNEAAKRIGSYTENPQSVYIQGPSVTPSQVPQQPPLPAQQVRSAMGGVIKQPSPRIEEDLQRYAQPDELMQRGIVRPPNPIEQSLGGGYGFAQDLAREVTDLPNLAPPIDPEYPMVRPQQNLWNQLAGRAMETILPFYDAEQPVPLPNPQPVPEPTPPLPIRQSETEPIYIPGPIGGQDVEEQLPDLEQMARIKQQMGMDLTTEEEQSLMRMPSGTPTTPQGLQASVGGTAPAPSIGQGGVKAYHGETSGPIEGDFDRGTHFGSTKSQAKGAIKTGKAHGAKTGGVGEYELSIKNPLRVTDSEANDISELYYAMRDEGKYPHLQKYLPKFDNEIASVLDLAEIAGYDGVVYKNRTEGGAKKVGRDSYMILNPSQVRKSQTTTPQQILKKATTKKPPLPLKTQKGSVVERSKKGVGKQIGGQTYVHKDYAKEVSPKVGQAEKILKKTHPKFKYNSVVVSPSGIRFDEAPDFDTAREPKVGNYVWVMNDGSTKTGKSENIWHHKWMWVKDDYKGFNVQSSKNWSKKWLGKVPDKAKGTKEGFEEQLKGSQSAEDQLKKMTRGQKIDSSGTSLNQIPATFKSHAWKKGQRVVDVGGGKFDLGTNYLKDEHGVENIVIDPQSRSAEYNKKSIEKLNKKPADVGSIMNTLNTIPKSNRREAMKTSIRHTKPDAVHLIQIYEGDGSGVGGETPRGWQNNLKTEAYIPEVKKLFKDVTRKGNLITARNPKNQAPLPIDRDKNIKKFMEGSKVVDEQGQPKVVYSGHSNVGMYGKSFDPKKATAGGFYATEDPEIASSYAKGKFGRMEEYEHGSQYRIAGKNKKYNKKLWQIDLTDEQKQKIDALKLQKDEYGNSEHPIAEMDRWIKESKDYDKDARRMSYRGSHDLQNIHDFYEQMGDTIHHYDWQDNESSANRVSAVEAYRPSNFEELLNAIGLDWNSYDKPQPGVMPVYMNIKNPIDTSKPFPEDLMKSLKQKAKYEREPKYDPMDTHWTRDYPLKKWIQDIEEGNEFWSTQIPKKAIPIIKQYGYDGIKDTGGKGGGKKHSVWIGLESGQIKSSTGNRGTFDPSIKDLTAKKQELQTIRRA